MANKASKRINTEKELTKTLKKQNPGYDDATIEIMVTYQLGGWDSVNILLADRNAPSITELLGMED